MTIAAPIKPLPPGATLGVMGGGQLGRMFSQAASHMGYRVCVLDPAAVSPAAEVSAEHIQASYDDEAALTELAKRCDAVTTEFENVPADSLRILQQKVFVAPPPEAVEIAQDRNREKTFFKEAGLPVNHFVAIKSAADIEAAFAQMNGKAILKTAQLGYDGKGQAVCDSAREVHTAFDSFDGVPCILEDFVAFDLEVSVVLARDVHGQTVTYPVVENQHKNGILDICVVPARVPDTVSEAAQIVATKLAQALNYVGVLAVEMFVTGDQLALNEIAPRPHNSGHYTMDACNASQFVQQVRTMCGLPVSPGRFDSGRWL